MKAIDLIKQELSTLSTEDKIDYLNNLMNDISELSPLQEPVRNVQWIPIESIQANEYNPNSVAGPEMELLYESIKTDGYTMPAVVFDMGDGKYEIVDGFHRSKTLRTREDIKSRTHGRLPVVILKKSLDDRMGSTIRHNRARGTHSIKSMSDIVLQLIKEGWSDDKICEKLGMDREEVLRMKQVSGLKEAFMNYDFSPSWETFERKHFPNEIGITKKVAKRPERKGPVGE